MFTQSFIQTFSLNLRYNTLFRHKQDKRLYSMACSSLSTELLQMVSIKRYIQNYISSHLQSTVFMVLYDSLCMCEEDCHSNELSRCSLEAAGYRKDGGCVSWVQASSSTSVCRSSFSILTYHPTLLPPTPSRKWKSSLSANCLI